MVSKEKQHKPKLNRLLTCNHEHAPKPKTANKIIKVLKEFEPNLKLEDLWKYKKKSWF
jgi:hypothetical protein